MSNNRHAQAGKIYEELINIQRRLEELRDEEQGNFLDQTGLAAEAAEMAFLKLDEAVKLAQKAAKAVAAVWAIRP